MPTFEKNLEKNGIEISFDSIPEEEVRSELKRNGFRWHRANKLWYAKETPERLKLVEKLCGKAEKKRYCYCSLLQDFLSIDKKNWLSIMKREFSLEYGLQLEKLQELAWEDCFDNLQEFLRLIDNKNKMFDIVFEYSLPYESGRRPDVLLISEEQVIILEFKMKDKFLPEDIDQVAAYARDISEYHYESRNKLVTPILVLTKSVNKKPNKLSNGVIISSVNYLSTLINKESLETVTSCNIDNWINSRYEPLPTIVDAAKKFMENESLPNIKKIASTGIPDAIKFLKELTDDAKVNKKHILALVTGVPGAGKTYLGLQYVYDVCKLSENVNSVYLSGNGPLIEVLTDALNSDVFVKNIHTVVNEHILGKTKGFNKNILVFDEGQRAWDKEQMFKKRNTTMSEADILIDLAGRELEWSVLLILVGEGQEINTGENSGLIQWDTALRKSDKNWIVVCPDKLVNIFKEAHQVIANDNFNLNKTLRSYLANDVSKFIKSDNNYVFPKETTALELYNTFMFRDAEKTEYNVTNMYVTRDLKKAKEYCKNRYSDNKNKRYGILASSKAYNLSYYSIKPIFKPQISKWFNSEPFESESCCQLNIAISEFDCQGLEIDMPIIGWGIDMLWNGNNWDKFKKDEGIDSESNIYRKNSYRVLLTRGTQYTVRHGSTIIELTPSYLQTLSVGSHTMTVVYTNGSVSTTFSVRRAVVGSGRTVATSDNSRVQMWSIACMIALMSLLVSAYYRIKKA